MILPLDVAFELLAIEVHVSQIAGAVSRRLVVEMRRRGVAALAAGRDRSGLHAIAELDDRHEAVAGRPVHLLRPFVGARAERGQRAPARRGETDCNAWPRVLEGLNDLSVEALVPIDVAPRSPPTPEIAREPVRRGRERLQQLLPRRLANVGVGGYAGLARSV